MGPFGDDLLRQHVLVVRSDVDGDPRLLLKGRHQGMGGLHVLTAIERDGVGARAGTRAAAGGQADGTQGEGNRAGQDTRGSHALLTDFSRGHPTAAPHQGVPTLMAPEVPRRPSPPWTPPATGRQRMVSSPRWMIFGQRIFRLVNFRVDES